MTDHQQQDLAAAPKIVPGIAEQVVQVAQQDVADHISVKRLQDLVAEAVSSAENKDAIRYGVVMGHLAALALAQAAAAAIPQIQILLPGDLH
jgi:hypothetical protein